MNDGDERVSLLLSDMIYEIPRAAASKSVFLASVLEMQDGDQVIPVPFVAREDVAQVLHAFFHDNPFFPQRWPPYLCYHVLLVANGMDMPSLLELCVAEIAARWSSSTEKEIRATWGLEDNLSEEEKGAIQKENTLLEIFDTDTSKGQASDANREAIETKWAWPPEMLFLILSKLPTRELARVRVVCVEFCSIIHSMPGRGDLAVSGKILQKNTTVPFVERHCLLETNRIDSLHSLKKLKYLVIGSNSKIGPEGATALSTLHDLQKLEIHFDNNIGAEGAQALSTLQNLEELEIGWANNIGPAGATALSSLQNLQHLQIGPGNNIGPEGAAALSTLQNLKCLKIGWNNNIGAAGATALSALQNLQYLEIGWDNNIGTEGIHALFHLKNLQMLKIARDGNQFSKTEEKELQALLPNTKIGFY